MKKLLSSLFGRISILMLMFVGICCQMFAFEGSAPVDGQKYYLYNIYQAKFLGANNKLQAPNIGTPIAYAVSSNAITIGSTTWTLSEKDAYYQLKNAGKFFAFEDKQADPEEPDDENRALYLGGGVTCQPTSNDTDRSYWQLISETDMRSGRQRRSLPWQV